jgi:hypothetical protein
MAIGGFPLGLIRYSMANVQHVGMCEKCPFGWGFLQKKISRSLLLKTPNPG